MALAFSRAMDRLVLRLQARVEGVTEQELLRRILVKIRPSMQVKGWHNG